MKFHVFKIIIRFFFIIPSVAGLFILFSCDDSLKFRNPQPNNKNSLEEIPKELWGWYASTEDSFIIQVAGRHIQEYEYKYRGKFSTSYLDQVETDTIFSLESDHIRRYQGSYYFNKLDDDKEYWEVSKLIVHGDSLFFNVVWIKDIDIDELQNLLVVESVYDEDDELEYYLCNPTKKEWKKLNKGDYFSHPYFTFFKIKG